MQLPFGIQQSTLAGGITGVAAWAIGIGLTAAGIAVPASVISGIVAILIPVVVHFVPDAAKVDQQIKSIAKDIPQTYEEFPEDPTPSTTVNNLNKS